MTSTSLLVNIPAPGVSFFTPFQNPPAGTAKVKAGEDPSSVPSPFRPITIRGVTFPNRIWVRMVLLGW